MFNRREETTDPLGFTAWHLAFQAVDNTNIEGNPANSDCDDNSTGSGMEIDLHSVSSRAPSTRRDRVGGLSNPTEANVPASLNDIEANDPRSRNDVEVNEQTTCNDDRNDIFNSMVSTQPETIEWSTIDANHDKYYPKDSYSFIALNGPSIECGGISWPLEKMRLFVFGMLPFLFQMSFFVLLFFHFKNEMVGRSDREHTGMALMNPRTDIVIAQIASLLAYMLYPNSSQQDVVRAIQMFPWNPCPSDTKDVPVGCIRISCLARGIQSHCAISVVFLLVMTCDSTLDIILNLTAANFISELDSKAFVLAGTGVFGPKLEDEAKRIAKKELPSCSHSETKHLCYGMLLVMYALIFGAFGIVMIVLKTEFDYYWMINKTILMVGTVGGTTLLITIFASVYTACRNRCEEEDVEEGTNKKSASKVEESTRTRATVPTRLSLDLCSTEDQQDGQ